MSEQPSLFKENLVLDQINYPWAVQIQHALQDGLWTDREFSFRADVTQFHSEMSPKQQRVFTRTMSAIAQIEVAVKTFWSKLGTFFPHHEMSNLGFVLAYSEVVHGDAYKRDLEELGLTAQFRENLEHEVFQRRVKYLRKHAEKTYSDERQQLVYSLMLFTLFVENVSLFSQFYIALHFSAKHSLMPGTAQQVKYTRHEEMMHALVGAKIINTLREEHPELFDESMYEKVAEECLEAFEAESKLADWLLEDYVDEGLSAAHLKVFIKQRLNDSVEMIGYTAPHELMLSVEEEELLAETRWFDEGLLATAHVDFFDTRSVAYNKGRTFDAESLRGGIHA